MEHKNYLPTTVFQMLMLRFKELQVLLWMFAAWMPTRTTLLSLGSSQLSMVATPSWATLWTGQSVFGCLRLSDN